ncbi:MAG: exodeoxyribonuclease V subunit beta [Proteobacteria bacterium]|nr:exodeoxyribonuclease V subunit beta [Pseudomonadota bacterium]MBU1641106.1 exodeoxyribonuclease V subunit beta [Pseudomonadota bacterium]
MADLLDKKLHGLHLIDASAGTGKTYTITALVVRLLLEERLTIQQILVVTYTEAAATDLRVRIREMLALARSSFSGHNSKEEFLARLHTKIADHDQARRDLSCALNDFDEAAIYTIHGFCQRMLKENGLESATLFDVELAADLSGIHWQVVCDYWRQSVVGYGPLFLHYLNDKLSPDKLLKLLNNQRPGLKVCPESSGAVPSPELEREFVRLYEEGVALWPEAVGEVAKILRDPALNLQKFQQKSVDKWLLAISAYFKGELLLPPDVLYKVSQDNLNQGVKQGRQPPHHPFCAYADRLWQAWQQICGQLLEMKAGLFPYAAQKIAEVKEEQRLLGFDDLLTRLQAALAGPEGERLAAAIRRKYPAALIDEFQDTDPVQFEIFQRIHGGNKEHLLYLIGDPKQAIYNFRGADIFAYLAAARAVKSRYSLEDNYRSEPGLITAINAVFSEKSGLASFVFADIVFTPAKWPGLASAQLVVDQGEHAPLQIMLAEGGADGKQLASPDSKVVATTACSAEIVRLLQLSSQGQARIGDRPLVPGDIAVLVRTNAEARQVHQALLDVGVASVVKSTDDLFTSHEARELVAVLMAVAEPSMDKRLVAALATDILGWSAVALFGRSEDELGWDGVLERFAEYHRLWHDKGFMSMFQALVSGEQVRERLLRLHDGERRLTNLLHLGEVLQGQSRLSSHHLIDYLKQGVAGRHRGEHEQRLESDALRLQIVTVHKAKGLQYPVVFCPFLWGGSKIGGHREVFFHQDKNELILDIGSAEFEVHKEIALIEELAENLRLAYVALTRAKNRCYVVWGPLYGFQESALGHLFHGRADEERGELLSRLKAMSGPDLGQELAGLVERAAGEIALLACPAEVGEVSIAVEEIPALACRPFTASVDRSWQVSSFSRLTAGLHQEAYIADHDRSLLPEADRLPEGEAAALSIFDFPKGAGPGTFLHHLFENLDFGDFRAGRDVAVREWLAAKLGQFGFAGFWNDPVGKMLNEVVSAQLPGQNFCLADLEPAARLNELEFHLPLAQSRAADLLEVFSRHNHAGGTEFLAQLGRLDYALVQGFLKGFVDLVFCHGGRFYIIDWKSNYLGNQTDDYGRSQLQAAMIEANYTLQYHLYSVALHRYLASRLLDYEYERHFGGVFYIFLRGVRQGSDNGIFFDRPQLPLIDELADLLVQPGQIQGGGPQ